MLSSYPLTADDFVPARLPGLEPDMPEFLKNFLFGDMPPPPESSDSSSAPADLIRDVEADGPAQLQTFFRGGRVIGVRLLRTDPMAEGAVELYQATSQPGSAETTAQPVSRVEAYFRYEGTSTRMNLISATISDDGTSLLDYRLNTANGPVNVAYLIDDTGNAVLTPPSSSASLLTNVAVGACVTVVIGAAVLGLWAVSDWRNMNDVFTSSRDASPAPAPDSNPAPAPASSPASTDLHLLPTTAETGADAIDTGAGDLFPHPALILLPALGQPGSMPISPDANVIADLSELRESVHVWTSRWAPSALMSAECSDSVGPYDESSTSANVYLNPLGDPAPGFGSELTSETVATPQSELQCQGADSLDEQPGELALIGTPASVQPG